MKRARKSWHTKTNCMIRSRVEFVRRSIRANLKEFVGKLCNTDTRDEMAFQISQALNALYYPSCKVTRAGIEGDTLHVDFTYYPPPYILDIEPSMVAASQEG